MEVLFCFYMSWVRCNSGLYFSDAYVNVHDKWDQLLSKYSFFHGSDCCLCFGWLLGLCIAFLYVIYDIERGWKMREVKLTVFSFSSSILSAVGMLFKLTI